ncbi:hypothetical protein D3C73_1361490 [compost metagenome]
MLAATHIGEAPTQALFRNIQSSAQENGHLTSGYCSVWRKLICTHTIRNRSCRKNLNVIFCPVPYCISKGFSGVQHDEIAEMIGQEVNLLPIEFTTQES